MMQAEIYSVIRQVTSALDAVGVRYIIGGSVASTAVGEQRLTRDVDFVAEIKREDVAEFVTQFDESYYVDREMILDAIAHSSSFNLIHLGSGFKADVFVAGSDDWSRQQIDRRQSVAIGPDAEAPRAWIASPEDTVLQKLH